MLANLILGTALASSSVAALLVASPIVSTSDALITPGPQMELLKRQNDQRYMGWVADSKGAWSTEICDLGNTYYQGGSQWACCATTRAGCGNLAIGCVDGSMIYRATATGTDPLSNSLITRACTSIWTASSDASFTRCNTAFMFENDRDSSPKVNIVCGVSSVNWSYYRQAPAIATQSSSAVLTSRFTTTVPSRVSDTPTSTANSSPTPTSSILGDEGKGKSKSKAWIAGAVVGPILGLALIGLAAFLVMRRKKNKSHNQHIAPTTGGMPATGATAYQQNTYPTNPASPGPPQYYPNMQQNAGAAPLGVAKQDNYYGQSTNPVSPITSQGSQSPYGAPPQQWQQPGGQPVYGAPSPSMSPAPQTVQPAQYVVSETRPFSSELEGSYNHGKPQLINVQPNK